MISEVLLRQNFSRFVAAWDHQRPWFYYLGYFWQDFAPWSWFVPLAACLPLVDRKERRLLTLAWCWTVATVLFFSCSESKRSPYVLPIAPAVSMLAAAAIHRLVSGQLPHWLRAASMIIHGLQAVLFACTGLTLIVFIPSSFPQFRSMAILLGAVLLTGAFTIAVGIIFHNSRRALAPAVLGGTAIVVYLIAAVLVLPACNSFKSAKPVGQLLKNEREAGAAIGIYRAWIWRAEYSYYGEQNLNQLENPSALR
jgi:4-amino-4-deoxy-L-arabinose transferase-like glycosyltransferase